MAYVLVSNGVVVQKQPYHEDGFIDAPDWVVCGYLYDGQNFAPPPPPPEPVPQSVTRAQGKAALIQAGLWSAVVSYVEGIADPTEKALAEVALNDTLEWQRSSPFLNSAAAALGLTDEQLDDLFRQAATIQL